ncbi:receptor-like protein kinase FERONIA [Alnus glutinosa]|uniref:receptor-like protein kinase FERONIA n=1 Tax=Alnus glutinosa TaxID=3517 RepID=UPI002D785788|nr:receptor-like protein kinase FERONIA [Alnus glutinosa]
MWNGSRIRLWTTLLPCLAPLYLAFSLYHLTCTVAGGMPSTYTPVDIILLNCGSSRNSTSSDGRTWMGDVDSNKFSPVEQSQNQASIPVSPVQQSSSTEEVPYANARLSLSAFTYMFPVTAGQKFIRLYFYPASYHNFDRFNALFSVKAGRFTLLSNFSASLTADADGGSGDTILREYCVNIEEDRRLNLTFTPSVANSYAFINGIEILSMPLNLYYTPSDDKGFSFLGRPSLYRIENSTALEMVYRLNVGGPHISPTKDTGMFRVWNQDDNYLKIFEQLVLPANNTIELKFTKVPAYTAPEDVYRTARSMGTNNKSFNLTWEFPVDSGFDYLVRLHFCEFQSEITQEQDRVFLIFIANQTAEKAADVMVWSGGKGFPVYREYAVSMIGKEGEKKMNLPVALGASPQDYNDAILNGVEIFKVSTYNGNLAGSNPDPLPFTPPIVETPTPRTKSKNNRTTIFAVVGGGVSGFVVLSILGFLIFRQRKRVKDSGFSNGTTWWGPFSFSTTKSTKTHRSSLPSALCRNFSLAEIRAATNNFDGVFIIGVGGFGDVYKGHIDGGANPVAIKRLKPGSQQGAHEFETEIEMLSQLRHLHLVSLIGYCNEGYEMILVYDYMANGTLRDHLYNTHNPPLSWKQRLEICISAARGLNYLHTGAKHTIIHRDVKTTNILLDEKWEAKVSDFGLSKMGPTSASKTHVSTVVKGSFGYLDPEYFRRQQLTEKSDVYSFGVVLCEVLCARAPIMRSADKKQVSLAEWARQSHRNGKMDQIVDPTLKGEIAPECLNKYCEIAVNCLLDNGIERPSMNDVVWGLEFALQLQESDNKDVGLDGELEIEKKNDEKTLLPKSKIDDSNDSIDTFSSSGVQMSTINSNRNSSGEKSSGRLVVAIGIRAD